MNLKAKKLDNLKLFIFDSSKPAKAHKYELLKMYKWLFHVESALGMRRISTSDGCIRPPSILFRIFGLIVTCILLYHTYCNISKLLNQPGLTELCYSIDLIWHILSAVVLVKTVFLDGKTTVILFETFDEIDVRLNLLEDDRIFRMSSGRNGAVLCFVCLSYAAIAGVWLANGFMTIYRVHVVILMVLGELQLVICACLLSDVQARLTNLKCQLIKRFSLQNVDKGRRKTNILFNWFYEADAQEIKVDIELKDIVEIYGKIMKAFNLINRLFSMQVLFVFSVNFLSIIVSIWGMIMLLNLQEFSLTTLLGSIGWWQRMTLAIFFPCYICENITKDVDKLKSALLSLLGQECQKEHHPAATDLLYYCNASEPRFSVFGLFSVKMSLPFSFLQLIATHVIVLLQLSF